MLRNSGDPALVLTMGTETHLLFCVSVLQYTVDMRSTILVLSFVALATGSPVAPGTSCAYFVSEDGMSYMLNEKALPDFKEKTLLYHTYICQGHPDYCQYLVHCRAVAYPNPNFMLPIVDGSGCIMEPSIVEGIDYDGHRNLTIRARTFLLNGQITNLVMCSQSLEKKVNGVCIRPQCPKLEKSQ